MTEPNVEANMSAPLPNNIDPLATYSRQWAHNHLASDKRIFPIVPNDKRPATAHGFKDASGDPNRVEEWVSTFPGCNWAFVPGDHDLVVIDVDPRNGGSRDGWPATFTVRTPSGGCHFYYSLPGGLKSGSHKFGPGIDVKSNGGYVLLPGSQIDGREYTPEDPLAEYAPFPADRLEAFSAAKNKSTASQAKAEGRPVAVEELESVLRFLDPNAPRAEWVEEIAAIRATPGIEVEDLREIAHRYSSGEYHGATPERYTGDTDVDAVFDSMLPKEGGVGYGTLKAKARAKGWRDDMRSSEEVFGAAVAKLPPVSNENTPAAAEPKPRFHFLDARDLRGRRLPPPLFPGLLPAVGPFHIIGKQSSLKSFLMTEIGFSACTGLPAFGQWKPALDPGFFVYCANEGQDGFMAKRKPAWEKERGVDLREHPFLFLPTVPVARDDQREEEEFCAALAAKVAGQPVRIVVFDTEAHMSGAANSNAANEIKQVGLLAQRVAQRFQCAVGVIVHPAKHDKESSSGRGSQVNTEMFPTAWKVERQGEKADLLTRLTVIKARDDQDGAEHLFKGKLVDVLLPATSEGPQETYTSLVVGLASAQEANRYKARQPGVKRTARDETTLHVLAGIAEAGGSDVKQECTLNFAWIMERRHAEWLDQPAAIFDQVAGRPWSQEEKAAWGKARSNYRRRFEAPEKRERHFGDKAIAGVGKKDEEWRVYPQVAKRVFERDHAPDHEGDDE